MRYRSFRPPRCRAAGARRPPAGPPLRHLRQHAIELINDRRVGDRRDLQRKRLQRFAIRANHRAHCPQRRAEAAVRETVVELRHFHRRQIQRHRECSAGFGVRSPAPARNEQTSRDRSARRHPDRDHRREIQRSASARTSGTGPYIWCVKFSGARSCRRELDFDRCVVDTIGGVVAPVSRPPGTPTASRASRSGARHRARG